MKKLFKLLLVVGMVFSLIGCQSNDKGEQKDVNEFTLKIVIEDQSGETPEILFDDEVVVNGEVKTLEDFLVLAQKELNVEMEDSAYGKVILGMMGKTGDWDKGPWWLYESVNNDSCKEAGFCTGASELVVEDQDEFLFKLTNDM